MTYLRQAVAYLKLHWVSVLMLLTAVWRYASPTVIDYVHNHPKLSFWYGLVAIIVSFYLGSPVQTTLIARLRARLFVATGVNNDLVS